MRMGKPSHFFLSFRTLATLLKQETKSLLDLLFMKDKYHFIFS